MTLDELATRVAELNREKGWEDDDRSFGDEISLLVEELSEAFREYRNLRGFTETYYEPDAKGNPEPHGIPVELGDVLIRLLDTCNRHGIDIEEAVTLKLEYNATREYRHGGKRV